VEKGVGVLWKFLKFSLFCREKGGISLEWGKGGESCLKKKEHVGNVGPLCEEKTFLLKEREDSCFSWGGGKKKGKKRELVL